MSKGVKIIIVCEDQEQEMLLRRYMKKCNIDVCRYVRLTGVPSRRPHTQSKDAGTKNVRDTFVVEIKACRAMQNKHKVLLITMIDADKPKGNFESRRSELEKALGELGPLKPGDPYVLFVPKKNVETWIQAALGVEVNETEDYKTTNPTESDIRSAAEQIYGWARSAPKPGPTCIDSLEKSVTVQSPSGTRFGSVIRGYQGKAGNLIPI